MSEQKRANVVMADDNAVVPASALDWPSPHHMRVVDPRAGAERERGLVRLRTGEKLPGTVVRIDFDEATLQFLPDVGPSRLLQFSDFHSLMLERVIELERIPLAAPRAVWKRSLRT